MNKNMTLLVIIVSFFVITTQAEFLNNRLLQNTRGRNLSQTCLNTNKNDFLKEDLIKEGKKAR